MDNFSVDSAKDVILSLRLIENAGYDEKKKIRLLYTISNDIENNYREFKVAKKNGGYRILAEPSKMLKGIQRNILKNYLYKQSISPHVKSYIKGVSLKENALAHTGQKKILKLDIENFFDNVDFLKVYNYAFGPEKLPKSVGLLLTHLTTYYGALPQGAPTSAYISNIVMKDFDYIVGEYCHNLDVNYTRYSDDMTFSGDFDPKLIIRFVRRQLRKMGFNLNEDKIHVVSSSQSQVVTGITVNKKMRALKKYRYKIRQEIYYIKKYGLENHLLRIDYPKSKISYLRNLYGRISYASYIDSDDHELLEYKKYLKNNFVF